MRIKCCKTSVIALAAAVLLSGCENETGSGPSGGTINSINIVSGKTDSGSSVSFSEDLSSYESGTSTESPDSSEELSKTEEKWTEREYVADLFVTASIYGRDKPTSSAARTRIYEQNESVKIVAVTNTGFYKLDNGDYIFSDYLDSRKTTVPGTVKIDIPDKPPEDVFRSIDYNRAGALDYARKNWNAGKSLCAGFGSECLTAGGLEFNTTSSTKLFNQLVDSGLGYAVGIDLNPDGTAYAPDFAFPGDMVFLYCRAENMMVHTAVYNGMTEDGLIRAYAHNPADNGENGFKYYKYCIGGCGYELDKMVVFCFYRDGGDKLPESLPELSAVNTDYGVRFDWKADFVYYESELIISDSSGQVVCRWETGTDTSELVGITPLGEYSAVIRMKIPDGTYVSSNTVKFLIE